MSSKPLKASLTSGSWNVVRFKYTREVLSKNAAVTKAAAKVPTKGINDNMEVAPTDIKPIITLIKNRIPILPFICLFAALFNFDLSKTFPSYFAHNGNFYIFIIQHIPTNFNSMNMFFQSDVNFP